MDRHAIRRHQAKRQAERVRQRTRRRRIDAIREAEAVIRSATKVDISKWSDEQLDEAMNRVCNAYDVLLREETHAAYY
jgi:hypothetical protein